MIDLFFSSYLKRLPTTTTTKLTLVKAGRRNWRRQKRNAGIERQQLLHLAPWRRLLSLQLGRTHLHRCLKGPVLDHLLNLLLARRFNERNGQKQNEEAV